MQTTLLNPQYLIKGVFLNELSNRFLCEVKIKGKSVICYIPSSSRLSNYLNLHGCEVLLNRVLSKKTRTQFAVFAIKYKQNYILLNTSLSNLIIENEIRSRRFAILGKRSIVKREKLIEGYKCDLFIGNSGSIIEIKSIISLDHIAFFPTVYSQRAIEQLTKLSTLLDRGFPVYYFFVSLNPYVKQINICRDSTYYQLFQECVSKGMKFFGVSVHIKNQVVKIKNTICIKM